MSERIEVGSVDEFETQNRKLLEVKGVEIGVFNVDGEFHALLNNCPHQHGPLAEGEVMRKVVADVPETGERVEDCYDPETCVIKCPNHGWGFDVATGENIADSERIPGVPTYDVVVEDGKVFLEL